MLAPLVTLLALAPDASAASDLSLPRSTPAIPAAELRGDLPPRANGTPEILYINFDGGVLQTGCGNDPHHDCSTLAHLFDGYVGPYDGNETQRISILQATRKDVQEFAVNVVIDRPPDDVDYTMVMYGDLGEQSFAGIAPYIDCEDRRGGDTSFTQGFGTSNTGSTVILQEAAHTWGLEHVDAEFDILNPFKTSGVNQSFLDECFPIVANTDLEPTPGVCNQVHTQYCETAHQNSWREMNLLFGPAVPDTTIPSLEITSPADGDTFVLPVTVPLLGDIEDDRHPQFYELTIFNNGEQQGDPLSRISLDLLLVNPPPGDYDLRVVLADEAGNATEDSVRFTVLEEGSELPEPEEDDGPGEPTEAGCTAGGKAPSPGLALLVLGLLVFGRRRR